MAIDDPPIKDRPVQKAEFLGASPADFVNVMRPEKKRIVKIEPTPNGMFGLDNEGNTYVAVTGKIDTEHLYWKLAIPNVED